ncbi:MAG TPA: alanine--glyoxylate aminotransferase family protein [Terrimicrobiaceae bacterium]|nr:alanine--glyoxylate aminotransferase family protein [Terrimicrobiaceae bacterium]
MQNSHVKLFIPGPVEVSEKTYRALCEPMIGHRSGDFKALYAGIQPRLQELFGTKRPVFLSTSSAWGVMEGAIRNLAGKKVLNCMCGAFSDKWLDVSKRCGRDAEALQVEWGQAISPEMIADRLAQGGFDALTLIHNETSCGVRNPLPEIAAVMRKFPEVMFIVDTVSSFSTEPIPMDELGIDVLLTGSQKALALPPGLALFAVSQKAMDRAATIEGRGYYFDFLEFAKNQEQDMTPSTPVIPLIYALRSKLDDIFSEGIAERHARHRKLNAIVHEWVAARGFEFFAPEGRRSLSLTCVQNNLGVDVAAWIKRLREKHRMVIDGGYGKIKGKTFRISNMGDETEESVRTLLAALDDTFAA